MSHQESPKKKNVPRDHQFDGIQEYDNDMPGWWVSLFIVTIIFSAIYMAWFHLPFFPSKSLSAEYDEAQAVANAAQAERDKKAESAEYDYKAAALDPAIVASGKETFVAMCSPCHGADGGGSVGPNLTDKFWLHGGTSAKIEDTIMNGVVAKGMPAWGAVVGVTKVREMVVYINTLLGTTPATPKEPQGTEESAE